MGPQSAALDRVFVTQPDLPPLDMTVLWHMPMIVFDHALILLRLPREMLGVGYAGACRPGESEVPSSRCCVNMPKWYTQVDEWRRLLQSCLQATESQRAPMDTFEALKMQSHVRAPLHKPWLQSIFGSQGRFASRLCLQAIVHYSES